MKFSALLNTVRWMVSDQRRLLAEGFGERDTYEMEVYIPIYASKHIFRDKGFARRRVIFVRDPKIFASVFKSSEELLDASSAYAFVKPYFGEKSILVEKGVSHHTAKQAVYNVISQNMQIGSDDVLFFGYTIGEIFKSGTYPVMRPVQLISGAFVLRTIFGEQGSELADETIQHAITEMESLSGVFLEMPAVVRWARRLGIGLSIRRERIALRKFVIRQIARTTVLDDWTSPAGRDVPVDRTTAVDNLMTILVAGFETTAATIAWLLYELANRPEIQIALRDEILRRINDGMLDYLAADDTLIARCVFEVMRLHPSLPFVVRQAIGEFPVGDLTAQPNDYIVLALEEMHQRYFGEDGARFRPERFQVKDGLPKLATFGGGIKACPGRAVAVQEIRTIVALIVLSFSLRLSDATDPRVGRNRVSATPKGGMVLSLDRISA
ncbi:MAG TPA: cytochrome P450 [Candidatus Acidoferrales bacterium]|nr:cytochrome P450 [Candidatus Acidoferrales bacterium]